MRRTTDAAAEVTSDKQRVAILAAYLLEIAVVAAAAGVRKPRALTADFAVLRKVESTDTGSGGQARPKVTSG
jgi:hypothetical protein